MPNIKRLQKMPEYRDAYELAQMYNQIVEVVNAQSDTIELLMQRVSLMDMALTGSQSKESDPRIAKPK